MAGKEANPSRPYIGHMTERLGSLLRRLECLELFGHIPRSEEDGMEKCRWRDGARTRSEGFEVFGSGGEVIQNLVDGLL